MSHVSASVQGMDQALVQVCVFFLLLPWENIGREFLTCTSTSLFSPCQGSVMNLIMIGDESLGYCAKKQEYGFLLSLHPWALSSHMMRPPQPLAEKMMNTSSQGSRRIHHHLLVPALPPTSRCINQFSILGQVSPNKKEGSRKPLCFRTEPYSLTVT